MSLKADQSTQNQMQQIRIAAIQCWHEVEEQRLKKEKIKKNNKG
jgi:hypothetical protein